jgi:hypothetical protein
MYPELQNETLVQDFWKLLRVLGTFVRKAVADKSKLSLLYILLNHETLIL